MDSGDLRDRGLPVSGGGRWQSDWAAAGRGDRPGVLRCAVVAGRTAHDAPQTLVRSPGGRGAAGAAGAQRRNERMEVRPTSAGKCHHVGVVSS